MTTLTAATPPSVAERWPDVVRIPAGLRASVSGHVARSIFRYAIRRLPLRVTLPDGQQIGQATSSGPSMIVHDEAAMTRRIGTGGLIGFGESYLAGEWDAPDLAAVIAVFATHIEQLVPRPLHPLRRAVFAAKPSSDRPTMQHSRHNIERHYDLSNDLFAAFLDPSMTYSGALFTDPTNAGWVDLGAAQRRKTERILDQARIGPGSRVLEIGTGWGELAIRAAKRGAIVDSVTLSSQQLTRARERVRQAGVSDRVHLSLTDYRDLSGEYDAIVSVEMVEAVGLDFLPTYFATLDRCLAPGGRVVLQAITLPHERALATAHTYTWIHKYVFPGGALPSVHLLDEHGQATGLRLVDECAMGSSYAATLRLWAQRFAERSTHLADLGFDEIFQRMWDFYLRYCEGGFRAGYLDVHQLTYIRQETA